MFGIGFFIGYEQAFFYLLSRIVSNKTKLTPHGMSTRISNAVDASPTTECFSSHSTSYTSSLVTLVKQKIEFELAPD